MSSTNFLQFNPAQMNQETDAAYLADAQRTGGAAVGAAFASPLANKLFYQISTFIAAFGQMLAAKGYDNSDTDITALQTVLANVKTAADFRADLVVLSYTSTPAYDCSANNAFQMQLTGNITAPTISGQVAGQVVRFIFQQDATGGRTVAWPAGVTSTPYVNPAPNAWTVADFVVTNDLALRPVSAQGFTSGNNANGYWRRDPDGMIHQWGILTTDINSGTQAITFPTPYTQVASIVPTVTTYSPTDRITYIVKDSITVNGFTVGNNGSSGFATWHAFGY